MDLTKSILQDVRVGVGLAPTTTDFDTELLMYINSAIGKLNQNGVGKTLVVEDESQTWGDLQDPMQVEGNKLFQTIPTFVVMSSKLIFDPPPPSSVNFYVDTIQEHLWRLKVAYEPPYTPVVTTTDE